MNFRVSVLLRWPTRHASWNTLTGVIDKAYGRMRTTGRCAWNRLYQQTKERAEMHTEEHSRAMFHAWAETGRIESDELGREPDVDRFTALRYLCMALVDSTEPMPREMARRFRLHAGDTGETYGVAAKYVLGAMELVVHDDAWMAKVRPIMEMVSTTEVE